MPDAPLPEAALRRRDRLVVLLGLTAGASDVTAFERLGHVFASVVTGNMAVLVYGIVQADGRIALFAGVAVAAYAAGVLAGGPLAPSGEAQDENVPWPTGTNLALGAELVLLAGFAVVWELAPASPGRALSLVLLALLALAMGMQSAATGSLGNMSTTYLTGTLTSILDAVATRRVSRATARNTTIILMFIGGAAVGAVLLAHARGLVPALQLIPLLIVLAGSGRVGRPTAGANLSD